MGYMLTQVSFHISTHLLEFFTTAFYAFELYCSFQACWILSWVEVYQVITHEDQDQMKCIV